MDGFSLSSNDRHHDRRRRCVAGVTPAQCPRTIAPMEVLTGQVPRNLVGFDRSICCGNSQLVASSYDLADDRGVDLNSECLTCRHCRIAGLHVARCIARRCVAMKAPEARARGQCGHVIFIYLISPSLTYDGINVDLPSTHGRRSWGDAGDKSHPRIWNRGTLLQIVPLRFLSYRYRKERSVAFKTRQNPFSARALPRTPLGELTTLPRLPSRLERGHPSPYPTPFGTDPPSALAMSPPQNSGQIYAYASTDCET